MIRNNLRVFAPGSIRALACRVWCPRRTLFQPGAHALLRFAHHVQHPSLISIVMELSYEAKRRVAPASCWPRPSDAGTSACSGVSSARVTATLALHRRVRHPALPGVNLTALGLREAKGHTSKTRTTSSEPAFRAASASRSRTGISLRRFSKSVIRMSMNATLSISGRIDNLRGHRDGKICGATKLVNCVTTHG